MVPVRYCNNGFLVCIRIIVLLEKNLSITVRLGGRLAAEWCRQCDMARRGKGGTLGEKSNNEDIHNPRYKIIPTEKDRSAMK